MVLRFLNFSPHFLTIAIVLEGLVTLGLAQPSLAFFTSSSMQSNNTSLCGNGHCREICKESNWHCSNGTSTIYVITTIWIPRTTSLFDRPWWEDPFPTDPWDPSPAPSIRTIRDFVTSQLVTCDTTGSQNANSWCSQLHWSTTSLKTTTNIQTLESNVFTTEHWPSRECPVSTSTVICPDWIATCVDVDYPLPTITSTETDTTSITATVTSFYTVEEDEPETTSSSPLSLSQEISTHLRDIRLRQDDGDDRDSDDWTTTCPPSTTTTTEYRTNVLHTVVTTLTHTYTDTETAYDTVRVKRRTTQSDGKAKYLTSLSEARSIIISPSPERALQPSSTDLLSSSPRVALSSQVTPIIPPVNLDQALSGPGMVLSDGATLLPGAATSIHGVHISLPTSASGGIFVNGHFLSVAAVSSQGESHVRIELRLITVAELLSHLPLDLFASNGKALKPGSVLYVDGHIIELSEDGSTILVDGAPVDTILPIVKSDDVIGALITLPTGNVVILMTSSKATLAFAALSSGASVFLSANPLTSIASKQEICEATGGQLPDAGTTTPNNTPFTGGFSTPTFTRKGSRDLMIFMLIIIALEVLPW